MLNKYIAKHKNAGCGFCLPTIVCADGFTMSVQVGGGHYCSPRQDYDEEKRNRGIFYTAAEVGYPSEKVNEFMEYIDGDEETDPTGTVYGYVPVFVIEKIIEDHGGLKE